MIYLYLSICFLEQKHPKLKDSQPNHMNNRQDYHACNHCYCCYARMVPPIGDGIYISIAQVLLSIDILQYATSTCNASSIVLCILFFNTCLITGVAFTQPSSSPIRYTVYNVARIIYILNRRKILLSKMTLFLTFYIIYQLT